MKPVAIGKLHFVMVLDQSFPLSISMEKGGHTWAILECILFGHIKSAAVQQPISKLDPSLYEDNEKVPKLLSYATTSSCALPSVEMKNETRNGPSVESSKWTRTNGHVCFKLTWIPNNFVLHDQWSQEEELVICFASKENNGEMKIRVQVDPIYGFDVTQLTLLNEAMKKDQSPDNYLFEIERDLILVDKFCKFHRAICHQWGIVSNGDCNEMSTMVWFVALMQTPDDSHVIILEYRTNRLDGTPIILEMMERVANGLQIISVGN